MRKIQAVLVSLLMAVGIVGVAAAPAEAAPGCALGRFCLHVSSTSNPYWTRTDAQNPIGTCRTVSPQNLSKFVTNNSFSNYDVFLTGSCTGTPGLITQNSAGPMNAYWSDRIRGVRRRPPA